MRGAAILTRTSSLWLIALALYVALKTGAGMQIVSQTIADADVALHDSYYVVADIRYLIATGSMFAIFAAFYFWCERAWGRAYDDRLGKAHFVLAAGGLALIAAPQVALFMRGMPARYVDYTADFAFWNTMSIAGYVLFALSLIPLGMVLIAGYLKSREAA